MLPQWQPHPQQPRGWLRPWLTATATTAAMPSRHLLAMELVVRMRPPGRRRHHHHLQQRNEPWQWTRASRPGPRGVCGVVSALAVCASVCLVAVYAHVRITEVEWQLEQAQAASFESKVSMRESLSGVQGGVELLTTLFAEWREKAEAEAVRRYDGTSRKTTAALGELEELQYRVALHQRFTCGMLQWLVGWSSGLYGNAKARSQLLSVLLSVQQHAASLVASCGEIHAHGGQVVHLMRRLGSGSCGAGDGDMGGGGGVGGSSDCSAPESSRTTESNTSDTSNGSAAEWRMQRWCQRVLLSAPLCLDWRV